MKKIKIEKFEAITNPYSNDVVWLVEGIVVHHSHIPDTIKSIVYAEHEKDLQLSTIKVPVIVSELDVFKESNWKIDFHGIIGMNEEDQNKFISDTTKPYICVVLGQLVIGTPLFDTRERVDKLELQPTDFINCMSLYEKDLLKKFKNSENEFRMD